MFSVDQGWCLVGLTSIITLLGCCVIYLDIIYKFLFPKIYARHPFQINNNTEFLVCSLSLSSGCLIITSLYKMLPESVSYLKKVAYLHDNKAAISLIQFGFYFGGILICSFLNAMVHLCTGESLVHCVHDDAHAHDSNSSGGHSNSPANVKLPNLNENGKLLINHKAHTHNHSDIHEHNQILPIREKTSLMDISITALRGKKLTGDCYGDLDSCDIDSTIDTHHKHHPGELKFCTRPSEENILFINKDHLINNDDELRKKYPNLQVHSPLLRNTTGLASYGTRVEGNAHTQVQMDNFESNENFHDLEHQHQHHHHIKTPLSRLLSIGIQTILAIIIHKFPEGFIMYATSKASSELGLMIFFSMFIHNFVEGFTMTLPIYIALNSRWKALLISGSLGGAAQPLGAFLGWLLFKGNMDMNNQFNCFLLGALMALTSGFLTFISLQMFASSIGFGGKQDKVIYWAFCGIGLILLSNLLIL